MNNLETYFLKPGYIFASPEKSIIKTVLGSCISICLWDERNKFGGMNHFIYPHNEINERNCRYGNVAVPYLLNLMINLGSYKKDIIAHVTGGANNPILETNIGKKNIEMAFNILSKKDIRISVQDVGGELGRKLEFNTSTGEIFINKGVNLRVDDWYK